MPKITIPATITLDLPAAAEWADIFKAVDEAKPQPKVTTKVVAPATAKKLTPMPAAVLERLQQAAGGYRWVSMRNMKNHLRHQFRKPISNGSVHQLVHLLRSEHGYEIETHPKMGGGYRLIKEAS